MSDEIRDYKTEAEIKSLIAGFENCSLPRSEWNPGLTQTRIVIATETQCREAIPSYREITSLSLVMTQFRHFCVSPRIIKRI